MPNTQQRFAALYAAFNARDIDAVLAGMAPDVDWPNAMEGSRLRGREAVREYWTRQWAMVTPRVEPVRVADDGRGEVVVDVHQVVHDLTGVLLVDQMVQHVYRLDDDGLVTRMDVRIAA